MPAMIPQQALALALEHHRAGRLAEAEGLYRQILAANPGHADALHLLGVVAHQTGRHDIAIGWIRQAIALAPNQPAYFSNLGSSLLDAGRLDEAVGAYRTAVQIQPDSPKLHFNLGGALRKKRDHLDDAVAAYRRAIALDPGYAEAHNNLGTALQQQGRPDEAAAAFRRAIECKPEYAEAHSNLGAILAVQGRFDEAAAAFRGALASNPAEAHNNLGAILSAQGRFDEAVAAFRRALEFNPGYVDAEANLGGALRGKGDIEGGIAAYQRGLRLRLDCGEMHIYLGNAYKDLGRTDDAVAAYRTAIQFRPDSAEAHNNLGVILNECGHIEEAAAACRRAVELKPDYAAAYGNLGNALANWCRPDESIAAHRRALALQPDCSAAHSNLLLSLHYLPEADTTAEAIFAEHLEWARLCELPLENTSARHSNDRTTGRRLRVGYVSPDFRMHSVAFFIEGLLAAHDPAQVEVFCYANLVREDAVGARLRSHAAQWRRITGLGDETVARLVRGDGIDILVDLAGHTSGNRLPVFARRPAPVQVTAIGYCGTTGLRAMDFRLTDALADPPGTTGHLHTERLVRLPCAWCFRPPADAPPITGTPATHEGHVTFGCFNARPKMNEMTFAIWARILRAIPGSRLLLKNSALRDPAVQHETREFFTRAGIPPERIELLGWLPSPAEHLAAYARVDIALDTFPYHGTTTTCEALWMGVPVITLAGSKHASRVGVSLLTNVGLPEFIAHTGDGCVHLATELAADLPRLAALRASMRARMQASPLLDAPGFARSVEAAYREMWTAWCASEQR